MANPRIKHPRIITTASASPQFDPVAYEAQGLHRAQASAWETVNIDDYMQPAAVSPYDPSRSLTPSPVLPARIQTATHAVRAQPMLCAPPPFKFPVRNFDFFLSQLPPTMQPFSHTDAYTTENGLVSYHAFSEADGVSRICMIGTVADMREVSAQMHRSNAFAPLPTLPMWFYQPPPPPQVYDQPTPYLHQPQPTYHPNMALPVHTLFQTQSDFAPPPTATAGPARKPRKSRAKQKAAQQP